MGTLGIFQYFFGKKKLVVDMIIFLLLTFLVHVIQIPLSDSLSCHCLISFSAMKITKVSFSKKAVTYCNMIRFR